MTKLLTLMTSLKAKLILLSIVVTLSFSGGWYMRTVFYDAAKAQTVEVKLEQAKKAPAAIINKHQALRKTNVDQDACAKSNIPADALRLLK